MTKAFFLLLFIFRQISFFVPYSEKISFYDYKIENYSQSVQVYREKNSVKIDIKYSFKKFPLISKGFLFLRVKNKDKIDELVKNIYYSSDSYTGYVQNVLLFLRKNIKYDEEKQSQTPLDVLKRGSGYCTGFTALSYELLKRAGVKVRKVSGFFFYSKKNVLQRHSWIEVFFPSDGWYAIDPVSGEFSDSYIYADIKENSIFLKDFTVSYAIEN